MNHVTLTGTVFQPESRVAKSGMTVLTFRLSYYQGKGKDGKATYGGIDVTASTGWRRRGMASCRIRTRPS